MDGVDVWIYGCMNLSYVQMYEYSVDGIDGIDGMDVWVYEWLDSVDGIDGMDVWMYEWLDGVVDNRVLNLSNLTIKHKCAPASRLGVI